MCQVVPKFCHPSCEKKNVPATKTRRTYSSCKKNNVCASQTTYVEVSIWTIIFSLAGAQTVNVVAHLNTRKLFSSPWGFLTFFSPCWGFFISILPLSLFFFCPTLFSLCLLGQQEWGLQNCCAKLEVAELGVREKYKLGSHAKWTHQELSPAVVLSGLLSSRQNNVQSGAIIPSPVWQGRVI